MNNSKPFLLSKFYGPQVTLDYFYTYLNIRVLVWNATNLQYVLESLWEHIFLIQEKVWILKKPGQIFSNILQNQFSVEYRK